VLKPMRGGTRKGPGSREEDLEGVNIRRGTTVSVRVTPACLVRTSRVQQSLELQRWCREVAPKNSRRDRSRRKAREAIAEGNPLKMQTWVASA
jgi:antitoxin component of MazEF toxin-antitoxin module